MPLAFLWAAILLLAVSGCNSNPNRALVGDWEPDLEATRASESFRNLPPEQRTVAEQGLAIFAQARVQFTEDGRFVVEAPGMREDGSFSVAQGEGSTLIVESKRSKDGKTKSFTATPDGNRLTLTLFGNQPVHFIKK